MKQNYSTKKKKKLIQISNLYEPYPYGVFLEKCHFFVGEEEEEPQRCEKWRKKKERKKTTTAREVEEEKKNRNNKTK